VLDQRGQLLRAALGFAGLPRPSYDRSLWALRTWLDSWSGIGRIAVGMARQGFDLQLTRYDERGWRATFYTTGMRALTDERDGHRMGAHAVARDAKSSLGSVEEVRGGQPMMRLASIKSLLVVLFLLTSTATAYAECAWVMWNENSVSSFDKLGRQADGERGWQIVLGSSDEHTCWRGAFEWAKEAASKALPVPGLQSSVDAGPNSVKTTYRRPGDGTIIFVTTARWVCLPDTVDPRGPKAQ
jgi:hypothetical protein